MILITEFMDQTAVDQLKSKAPVIYAPDLADRPSDIPAMLGEVQALIVRNRTRVTEDLLDAAPALSVVGRLGVGLDNIDQTACVDRGVKVIPATGANNVSVAEYVVTSALVLLRNAFQANDRMLEGRWPRQHCAGREAWGKTLGLVGYGAIARQTADRAIALGLEVCAHDPFVPTDDPAWEGVAPLSLDDLLQSADVVSLHLPLTHETRHLINADSLSLMRPDSVLINAARGGIVDEHALAEVLRGGQLAGAALDVFETEPLTAEAAEKFRGLGNLILTPHIAGVTQESNIRVSGTIADAVLETLNIA
ncbi:MAG: hydroxyacid dehydrogenase [Acidimicrobiales bacterium]